MPNTMIDRKQEHILLALCNTYPEVQRQGWRLATITAFAALDDVQACDGDFEALVRELRYVPDGYVIGPSELHFFEVEVHSPMSAAKLRAYGHFAIGCAFYGISFAVFSVNQHGHINEVDLLPHYAEWLEEARTPCARLGR
jgi:hypothetical protein